MSILESKPTENFLENPYISTMIGTIEQELRSSGYYTMVRSISHESDITQLLKNWNVDGIIFLYPDFENYMEPFLNTASIPVAIFDSSLTSPALINICSDDQKGLYLSTKYMINHGHTHIAFIADYEGNHILTGRLNGYRKALDESGIPFRPEYVLPYPPSYEGGIAAGKKMTASDEKYFHLAEESLYGEFAVTLGIDRDQVREFITNRIGEPEDMQPA